jgi:hypothetical protein
MINLFEELIQDIETEYNSNSNDLGWRFLQTARKTLEENNAIFLITSNPGGSKSSESVESCENGCAYISESWRGKAPGASKLQVQVQLLFQEISTRLGIEGYKKFMESSVCGHFIPFRSPSLDLLKEKDRSISFSKRLWKKILSNLKFKLIICIDKNTYENVTEILLELSYNKVETKKYPIAWGNYSASITNLEKSNDRACLLWFPHLSTFSIFGREKSKEAVNIILKEALKYYK